MLDLPTFDGSFTPPPPITAATPVAPVRSNALVAGLKSGTYSTGAALAGLGSGAAKLVGANDLSASLGQKATEYNADAAQVGRPDLDAQGWTGGGIGGFASKAAYTLGQAVPGLVGAGAAAVGAGALLPEEGVLAGGALVGRIGASLPKFLGGAGLGAGFGEEALGAKALIAGGKSAAAVGGAGAYMGAQSTGEQVNTAAEQPGGLTYGNAAKAFALGVPIGLVQGLAPAEGALLARGGLGRATGGVFETAIDSGLKNAAAGAVGSGLQAAADTSYDPNMTAGERASSIVSAVVGGAQAGGLLGGAIGALHGLKANQVDQGLKAAGLDPNNPAAEAAPTPPAPTPPAPAPEPVQQELPLSAPLSAAPADTQSSFLDLPSYDPGKTVPRAQRSDNSVKAEIQSAIAARDTAASDTTEQPVASATLRDALREPDAPPANAFAQQTVSDARIKVGRGSSDFKDLVASSTATNPAELYNELLSVDPTSKVAQSSQFTKLATRLGVGDNTLDQQLADLQANPDTANAKALSLVNFKLGLRDAAAKLREQPAQEPARPDAPAAETPAAPAPSAPAQPAQEPAPIAARPTSAPIISGDVPGLEPDRGGAQPAIRPSEGSQVDSGGSPTAVADAPPVDIVQQMNALLGRPGDAQTPAPAAEVDAQPKSITDRVLDVSRAAVGDKGGEVTISDIRKALPDVSAKDIDNALKEIHGDDSDTSLVQAPRGQRKDLDGVSVPGQGKFHSLDLEAREPQDAGVQVGSAAPEAARDQPGSSAPDGGADTPGAEAPGAGAPVAAAEGQQGPDAIPGQDPQAPVAAAPAPDKPGRLDAGTPYPGDVQKAADLGVTLPPRTDANAQAYDAVTQRLLGLHNMQTDGKQGATSFAAQLRDARSTFGQVVDPSATLQPLAPRKPPVERVPALAPQDPIAKSPEQMQLDLGKSAAAERLLAAAPDVKDAADQTTVALRKQAKAKTAMVETASGDQVPTAAVGSGPADLPQAMTSAPDLLTVPVPADSSALTDKPMTAKQKRAQAAVAKNVALNAENARVKTLPPAERQAARNASPNVADELKGPYDPKLDTPFPMNTPEPGGVNADGTPRPSKDANGRLLPRPNETPRELAFRQQGVDQFGAMLKSGTPFFGDEMLKTPQDVMPGVVSTILPREETQQHFDRFVDKLSPDVQDRIHLLSGSDPIPGGVPMGTRALGVYRDGQVYVNADMVRSRADIEDTLSHEVFGHLGNTADLGGVSGTFSEGLYQQRMLRLLDRTGSLDGMEALSRKEGTWAIGDDGHNLNGGAGMSAYFPPNGRRPTPAEAARLMDELVAHSSNITRTKLDGTILGAQAMIRRAIVNTLRRAGMHEFAKRMDRFGQPELAQWLKQTRQALTEQPKPGQVDMLAGATTPRHFLNNAEPVGEAPFMARLASKQRDTEGVMGAVTNLRTAALGSSSLKAALRGADGARREVVDSIMPANHFVEEGRRQGLTEMADHFEATKAQETAQTHLNGPGSTVAQNQVNLGIADAAQGKRLNRVMALATTNNMDPRVPLEKHTWLKPAEVEARRGAYTEMKSEYDKLGKPGKGGKITNGQQVYADQHAMSQADWYRARAMATHDVLKTVFDGKVDTGYDPVRRYAGMDHTLADGGRSVAEALHGKVGPSLDFWKGEYGRLQGLAEAHMTAEGGKQGNAGTSAYVDLATHVKASAEGEAAYTKQGSYFRLDRQGEHAVGFDIKPGVDADGKPNGPDQAAFDKIVEVMSKKFPNLSIGANRENGKVFARFPSPDQAEAFHNLVAKGEGNVKDGELRQYIDQEKGTHVSLMTDAMGSDDKVPFMQSMVDKTTATFDSDIAKLKDGDPQKAFMTAQRDKVVGNLRATMRDQMAESGMRSIQSRRENVQGFNADMLVGQRNASSAYARAAAATSFRTDKVDAIHAVNQKIEAAGKSQTADAVVKSSDMKRTFNAYNERNAAADVRTGPSYFSTIKSWMHTYQLGFSPAYFVMNLSQLGTTGLPELAKMHGFARSTAAMVKSLPEVGRLLHAMVSTRLDLGDGSKGPRAMHQGGITPAVLDRARLSPSMRAHTSDMVNHGHLELGSYSAANSGLGLGSMSRMDRFRHYASSTALLAETASRLVMSVAAKNLHDDAMKVPGAARDRLVKQFPTALDYAGHAVQEGMFQWGSYNTPKLFTAGGRLGAIGPLATQFHGFIPRLMEKLHRESMDGFTNRLGEGPDADAARAESRRFMFSHLAMTTAIAGGLGLPFAAYGAGVATKLSGQFLNQPYDVEQHLRNGLDDAFGPGVGEIMARGLPRYLGVDLSDLGDDGMGPLTKLMEDRRKFEDAAPAYLAHAWGSTAGAAINMVVAARDMAEGRFAEAGARALPTAFRNMARAYRVNELGYVNSQGERLPVPHGATEVLKTLLGFEGGQAAEEKEKQESLSGLKDDRQYREGQIMKTVMMGHAANDPAAVKQGMDAAAQYDKDNPGVGMLPRIAGQLQNRAKAQALGDRYGVLGINPKDRAARELVGS